MPRTTTPRLRPLSCRLMVHAAPPVVWFVLGGTTFSGSQGPTSPKQPGGGSWTPISKYTTHSTRSAADHSALMIPTEKHLCTPWIWRPPIRISLRAGNERGGVSTPPETNGPNGAGSPACSAIMCVTSSAPVTVIGAADVPRASTVFQNEFGPTLVRWNWPGPMGPCTASSRYHEGDACSLLSRERNGSAHAGKFGRFPA